MKRTLLLTISIAFLFSCTSNKRENVSKYYFPFDSFHNGKTYKYVVKSNERTDTLLWKFRSEVINNEKTLISEGIVNSVKVSKNKEILSNGISTNIESYIYESDNIGNVKEIHAVINNKENIVFLFNIRKNERYTLEVKYFSPANNTEITTTRIRKFKGFSTIPYQGKMINCAVFEGEEHYNSPRSTVVFKTIEYFGEGIGLIKSIKDYSNLHIESILSEVN